MLTLRSSDHDERRRVLAEMAARLIANEGVGAATVRRLAAEAGYSTTIVTHYFADKRQLLLHAYQASVQRSKRRFDAVVAADPSDVQGCLEAFMPIGEESLQDWRVHLAFCDKALDDSIFRDELRWWTRRADERIQEVLDARYGSRSAHAAMAFYLVTLIQGIAVRVSFESNWTDQRQRDFIGGELDRLMARPGGRSRSRDTVR